MAESSVQICNYALTLLGKERINSLSEDSTTARACNAIYELVRDACLSEHEWGFATEYVSLGAPLSDEPLFEYDYQFTLPTDCLRVIKTNLVDGSPWEISNGKLLCDSDSVYVKYIKKEESPSLYSPAFSKYLAARLAEELAFPLTGSRTLELDFHQRAERLRLSGFGQDSVEGDSNDQPVNDDYRTARY